MTLLDRLQAIRGDTAASGQSGILDVVASRLDELRGQRPTGKLLASDGLIDSIAQRIRNPAVTQIAQNQPQSQSKDKNSEENATPPATPGGSFTSNIPPGNTVPTLIHFH